MIKKLMTILMIGILIVFPIGSMQARAEMKPLSSESFRLVNVKLQSTCQATFTATTHYRTTIKINSCILQKKVGNIWTFDQSLSCPPSSSNVIRYSEKMDYSGKMTIGNTYRIVAVFNADGETRTATSDGITY